MTPEPTARVPPSEVLLALELSLRASLSVIDRLPTVRKVLVQRLLSKGIGHTAFKSTPIGDVPAEWEVRPLGEIASLTGGKTKPRDFSYRRSRSHCVPLYSASGLLGFTSVHLRKGSTVIVGRIGVHCGAVRFVSDEACWITDNALFVYETRSEIDMRFLSYSLCHRDLSSLRNMGRQPLISLATIYPVLLAVPPLAEQREISQVLLSVETLMEAQDKVLDQTKKLRSALLAGAGGEAPGPVQ